LRLLHRQDHEIVVSGICRSRSARGQRPRTRLRIYFNQTVPAVNRQANAGAFRVDYVSFCWQADELDGIASED
jgi:hypothetical protein